jgi:hypothetical protein
MPYNTLVRNKQMTPTETEKFVEKLKELRMTEDEKKIARAGKLGEAFGKFIGDLIGVALVSTFIWAVLTFIFALNIAWVKVLGALLLFNIIKNSIIISLKKLLK